MKEQSRSHKLTATLPGRVRALEIAGALQDLVEDAPAALTVFEERAEGASPPPWRIDAYFNGPRDAGLLRAELETVLGGAVPAFAVSDVPDCNWVALSQAALPPVRAGRFTVHGSHDRERVPQGPNAILIDAGEAFGTAHHPTTLGCLRAIDGLARRRDFARVLDLGCGSGVLAIAAARAWPRARITAVDIDPRSVAVARENAIANGAGNRIKPVCSTGTSASPVRRQAPYGLVLANILAAPLVGLAPELRNIMAPGAVAVLSGLLLHEAPSVIAAYRAQGFALQEHRRLGGWSALTLMKRGVAAARRRA
jgi:ribosomal protein L11 methyltransferase